VKANKLPRLTRFARGNGKKSKRWQLSVGSWQLSCSVSVNA
jgi:hypothetical protein